MEQPSKPGRFLRKLPRIALRLGILYVTIVAIMAFIQGWLVYRPYAEWESLPEGKPVTPGVVGMAYDDVTLTTADGVKLSAWYVHARRPIGTVLHCHGNAGNISHRIQLLAALHAARLDTLIFDYRGYGHSEGKASEEGTYRDAEAAWDYLVKQKHADPNRIVIHGQSLGGAVAAHLARNRPCAGLVLESTFANITDVGAEMYWFLPVRWMSRFDYATTEYVKDARCPVLVIHSRDDEMIPYRHGRRVFDAAPQPKQFVEIGGSHNDGSMESPNYEPELRRFVRKAMGVDASE